MYIIHYVDPDERVQRMRVAGPLTKDAAIDRAGRVVVQSLGTIMARVDELPVHGIAEFRDWKRHLSATVIRLS